MKILHVEDDNMDAHIIRTALCEYNSYGAIEIIHVTSLKEALKEIQQDCYQAVILDLGLRDVDGIDNIKAIKEQNPDMPIVVLTSTDCDKVAMQAIDSGAQEYLVKGHTDGKVMKLVLRSSIKRKALERRLFHQANYDSLTGLPNRSLLLEHLQKSLRVAQRWQHEQALIFFDINKFKLINDTYGHEAGNEILVDIAHRLIDELRQTDIITHYGGDEFVILLDDKSDDKTKAALCVAKKIVDAINKPFILSSKHVACISVSIGIGIYPNDGASVKELLCAADAAMYRAKSQAPNSIFLFADEKKISA